MLILNRRLYEAVIIRTPSGETVKVTVVAASDGRLRLGFEAHPDIRINREENDIPPPVCVDPVEMAIARADR